MAFLFCDGLDSYAATADLTKKWDTVGTGWTWDGTSGVTGGGCIKAAATAGATIMKKFQASQSAGSTIYCQFWVKLSTTPGSAQALMRPGNVGAVSSGGFGIGTTGKLYGISSGSTAVAGSAVEVGPSICDNIFHHIEFNYTEGNPGVFGGLWIDGIRYYTNVSGANFASTGLSELYFYTQGTGITITVDDPIVWDNTGSGMTTTPLGVRRIDTLRPSGAGNSAQFTPDTGSNYARVNETNADDDTSYVADTVSGHKDTYAFGDLSVTPTTVTAVVVNARAKTDAGRTTNLKLKTRTSTTEGTSAAIQLTPGYRVQQNAFVTDPTTAAAWSGSGINGAEFGIEVG